MLVVETTDLTKIYQKRYIALNALNMRVEKGSVYGLVGPNGAGKSTTFRLLVGLQRPTAGSVSVLGEPITGDRADLRRRIGFLPTNPSFPRHLTPIGYLEFVGKLLGMSSDQAKIQTVRLLQVVDLTAAAAQRLEGFSTGMMTRLGIASALMNDPELLILDEPTSGLDPSGRKQVIELIRQIAARDRTIIISTHILGDVERVCTDVGIISQGRLIYNGPMSEMRRLARQGTISVEVEGNLSAFEAQVSTLDEFASLRWERVGNEFRITFLGTQSLEEYIRRVMGLIRRSSVSNTGANNVNGAVAHPLASRQADGRCVHGLAWARLSDDRAWLSGDRAIKCPS